MHARSPVVAYRSFAFIENPPTQLTMCEIQTYEEKHLFLRAILANAVRSKHNVIHMSGNKGLELFESLDCLWICGGSALNGPFLLLLGFFNACQVLVFMNDEYHVIRRSPALLENLRAQNFRNVLLDRKSTRLNSSHITISYAVFCLKKKKK